MLKPDTKAIMAATYECAHDGCGFVGDIHSMYIPAASAPENRKETAKLAVCLIHSNLSCQGYESICEHLRRLKIPPAQQEVSQQVRHTYRRSRHYERYIQKRGNVYRKQALACGSKGKR